MELANSEMPCQECGAAPAVIVSHKLNYRKKQAPDGRKSVSEHCSTTYFYKCSHCGHTFGVVSGLGAPVLMQFRR